MSHRIALVTGAASGIGLATAKRLAHDGWTVALADRDPRVLGIAQAIEGGRGYGIVVDLADLEQAGALVGQVVQKLGRIDLLVNNAGIHPKRADGSKITVETMTAAQWTEVQTVNLTVPFILCREALIVLRRQHDAEREKGDDNVRARPLGRIVNISSRGGRTASPVANAAYAASKAGLIGFTRILAIEAADAGVTCNCVTPGPIETAMSSQTSPEGRAALSRSVPLGRYGDASEIASAVAFLASADASYMTGAVVDVNGGTFMP